MQIPKIHELYLVIVVGAGLVSAAIILLTEIINKTKILLDELKGLIDKLKILYLAIKEFSKRAKIPPSE